MNRTITNAIRFVLDELLPPKLRDARWFMTPFFYIWYKGDRKGIRQYMDFKSIAYNLTEEEFTDVYRNIKSLAEDRPTDLNKPSINFMLDHIDKSAATLLDVGCGRGYWLDQVHKTLPRLSLTGCDVKDHVELEGAQYVKGSIYELPFADKSFDVVTCHHTIEHLRDLPPAINELKRVAAKQLIIVTPRQRYYYYTMDLHLNFFPIAAYLQKEIGISDHDCREIFGDWVYIGRLDK